MPGPPLHHHGDKRGYSWNSPDYLRNRAIAVYAAGGRKWLDAYMKAAGGYPTVKNKIKKDVLKCIGPRRDDIKSRTTIDLDDWLDLWIEKPSTSEQETRVDHG